MYIYSCSHRWEDMLTCIYDAWTSKRGHTNIKLVFEPIGQLSVLDEYVHVEADINKFESVSNAIREKISDYVYERLAFASLAYEEDVLDVIYRVLLLGFSKGKEVLNMVQYRDVMRFNQICGRLSKEVNRFQEIIRFHQVRNEMFNSDIYVAHISPKSNLVLALGPIFMDRMPSEYFMIVDDVYREAVVHPKNKDCYLIKLNDEEFDNLLQTEEMNDEYTDMWKVFFESIAIKERENYVCQRNLFPIWARKNAIEFI